MVASRKAIPGSDPPIPVQPQAELDQLVLRELAVVGDPHQEQEQLRPRPPSSI